MVAATLGFLALQAGEWAGLDHWALACPPLFIYLL